MFKKIKVLFLAFFIVSFLTNNIVKAEENEETNGKVIFEEKEIKDLDVLMKRAKEEKEKGKLNKDENKFKKIHSESEAILVNEETGKKVKTETYYTTQLLKVIEKSDGETVKQYAVTSFSEVPNLDSLEQEESTSENIQVASFSGVFEYLSNKFLGDIFNKNDMFLGLTTIDDSGSLKVWSTNYITQTSSKIYITRTTGGWSRLDSTVTITFSDLLGYQNGFAWDTRKNLTQTTPLRETTSWDYNMSYYNWTPVNPNTGHSVGITGKFSLKRNTSTWTWTHMDRSYAEF
jgi:hypothetical protein